MVTKVRLFGGFRKYAGNETHIQFEQNEDLNVGEIKQRIAAELKRKNPGFCDLQLIEDSALATEEHVYSNGDPIIAGTELAILPPVCGG
jgi:molybdopterin converting factor small subunit